MKMGKIIAVVGCSGSGKTTYIQGHKKKYCHLYSEMFDNDPDLLQYKADRVYYHHRNNLFLSTAVLYSLQKNIHNTFVELTPRSFIRFLERGGFCNEVVILDTPFETCIKRAKDRFLSKKGGFIGSDRIKGQQEFLNNLKNNLILKLFKVKYIAI